MDGGGGEGAPTVGVEAFFFFIKPIRKARFHLYEFLLHAVVSISFDTIAPDEGSRFILTVCVFINVKSVVMNIV